METHFSEQQLKDKDNRSSEKILENVFIVVFVMQLAQHTNFWEMN